MQIREHFRDLELQMLETRESFPELLPRFRVIHGFFVRKQRAAETTASDIHSPSIKTFHRDFEAISSFR